MKKLLKRLALLITATLLLSALCGGGLAPVLAEEAGNGQTVTASEGTSEASDSSGGFDLEEDWWMLAAGLVLLVGIAVLVVALVSSKRRKKNIRKIINSTGDSRPGGNADNHATVRGDSADAFGNMNGGYPGGNMNGGYPGGNMNGGYPGGNMNGGYPGGNMNGGYPGGNMNGGFQGGSYGAGNTGTGTQRSFAEISFEEEKRRDFMNGTMEIKASNLMNLSANGGGTVRFTEQNQGLEIQVQETRDREGYYKEHTLYLDRELSIGRGPDNALVVNDRYVSTSHLKLSRETDGLYITDLKTVNGSKVNGVKLNGTQPLRSGDVVITGITTLKFSFDE